MIHMTVLVTSSAGDNLAILWFLCPGNSCTRDEVAVPSHTDNLFVPVYLYSTYKWPVESIDWCNSARFIYVNMTMSKQRCHHKHLRPSNKTVEYHTLDQTCNIVCTSCALYPGKPFQKHLRACSLSSELFHILSFLNNIHLFQCMVRYFVWNFKGCLWNSTQDISPIHGKAW